MIHDLLRANPPALWTAALFVPNRLRPLFGVWNVTCLTHPEQDHSRTTQEELSGKRAPGARRFSHFFRAGGRAGVGRGKVPSAASPGAILEGGIARLFREGRSPARKEPPRRGGACQGAGGPPGHPRHSRPVVPPRPGVLRGQATRSPAPTLT